MLEARLWWRNRRDNEHKLYRYGGMWSRARDVWTLEEAIASNNLELEIVAPATWILRMVVLNLAKRREGTCALRSTLKMQQAIWKRI
jgi:hypothetical protein